MSVMTASAWLAILSGIPIGLQLGATGTGGGILAVPMMVYIAGIPVQQATAMSLVIVAGSALFGSWDYGRAGLVKGKAALAFSWTGILGSWIGAYGNSLAQREILLILFGIMLLLSRALVTRHTQILAGTQQEEYCGTLFPRTCWIKMAGLGLVIGALNGFFGVGGGFMIVPALILVLGFPSRVAIGTSLTIITLISIGGILGHLQFGKVDAPLTGLVILGGTIGMFFGMRLSTVMSATTMSRVTALITVGVALSLIVLNTGKILGAQL
jgi:uncharacterized membrane protein YfcA